MKITLDGWKEGGNLMNNIKQASTRGCNGSKAPKAPKQKPTKANNEWSNNESNPNINNFKKDSNNASYSLGHVTHLQSIKK